MSLGRHVTNFSLWSARAVVSLLGTIETKYRAGERFFFWAGKRKEWAVLIAVEAVLIAVMLILFHVPLSYVRA